jgi:hypothetical protein
MLKTVIQPFEKWKKTGKNDCRHEKPLTLDRETVEYLERLKTKLPGLSDDKLITLALKYLDRKTDAIIRRRLLSRIRTLKKKGLSAEQIAEHLNKQKVPTLLGMQRWRSETVAEVLGKRDRTRTERRSE